MHRIRQGISFLIKSNLFIAFCAVAFVNTGVILSRARALTLEQEALIFSATFLTYNLTIFLVNLIGRRKPEAAGKIGWFLRNRFIMYLLLGVSSVILLWAFPYHSLRQSLFFLHLGGISILYNVPDRLANSAYRSIRSMPLLKVFLIAYVWSAIGAIYPVLLGDITHEGGFMLFFLFFCFIMAITLPFDIRDYIQDQNNLLLTVPGLIGIGPSKWLAIVCMLIYCTGLSQYFGLHLQSTILLLICFPLIWFSSQGNKDWYYTGLLDGIILLQFFLLRGY